jgi:phage baseplate assembly protein W
MNVDFPFRFDAEGRTADTTDDNHVRDLIEQVLFTAPGERVNRPNFGAGLLRLVFAPNGAELAAATQFLVQAALQEWLGDLIVIDEVTISGSDAQLVVAVRYTVRRTQESRRAVFPEGAAP